MRCRWCGKDGAEHQRGKAFFHDNCAREYDRAKDNSAVKPDVSEEMEAWFKFKDQHPGVAAQLDPDNYWTADGDDPPYTAQFFRDLHNALLSPWVFIDEDGSDEPSILRGDTFEDIAKHTNLDVDSLEDEAKLFFRGKLQRWTTKTIFALDTSAPDVPF